MNILQVCHKPPYPPKDGGCIAMNKITEGLIEHGNHVKVLCINTKKHPLSIGELPNEYINRTNIETVFIDTSIQPVKAFLNLFSSHSYHIIRFYSKVFENKLIAVLKKNHYDIIQLESLFVTPYLKAIRQHSKAKIVLRAHNVEYEIWEQLTRSTNSFFKKTYFQLIVERLKNYEINLLNSYDGIACISSKDEQKMKKVGCNIPLTTIPFGIDINEHPSGNISNTPSLFHIGSMDWLPNQEGVKWFLTHVWGTVHQQYPKLKFYIAGRNMPEWLKKSHFINVEVVGEVDDAKQFMQSKSIMLVPLLSGSGIRIKIIEGMALAKPIIATSVAARGIDYKHQKNILIADTPEQFIEMIIQMLSDKALSDSIGNDAYLLSKEHYDNKKIIENLMAFYKLLSSESKSGFPLK